MSKRHVDHSTAVEIVNEDSYQAVYTQVLQVWSLSGDILSIARNSLPRLWMAVAVCAAVAFGLGSKEATLAARARANCLKGLITCACCIADVLSKSQWRFRV